jgi:hypothetical protein
LVNLCFIFEIDCKKKNAKKLICPTAYIQQSIKSMRPLKIEPKEEEVEKVQKKVPVAKPKGKGKGKGKVVVEVEVVVEEPKQSSIDRDFKILDESLILDQSILSINQKDNLNEELRKPF